MPAAFTTLAIVAAADFGYVWVRARREWRDGTDLSRPTAWLITSLYVLTCALFGLASAWRPLALDLAPAAAIAAAFLVIAGAALTAPGLLPFASLRQLYGLERGRLITDGIYRYTRNPQYAGVGLMLLGAAALLGSGLALGLVVAYWIAIRIWLVVEEEHLRGAFGAAYERYLQRTPRFLGRSRDPQAFH